MRFRELVQTGPPTVLVLTEDWRAVVKLQGELADAHPDTTFVHVRGKKMRTVAGFFDELAAALQFPVWFGANWDALLDVVRDRGWLAGTVLGVYDAHELLADASERDVRNCADLLERFNRYGRAAGELPPVEPDDTDGFHVLAQLPAGDADSFCERWRALGLTVSSLDPA